MLTPGSRVRLSGLLSRPELNGRYGTIARSAASGRVGVLVDGDSKPLSIKLINLTECQDGIVEAFSGLSLTAAAEHASLTASGGISLPPELTRMVLEHLHFSALARIRCCSSVFRAATEDDTLWLPHRRSASRGLYMIGGRGGDHRGEDFIGETPVPDLTDMERFRDGAWKMLPPWPLARRNTGAAPLDGYIYVIGGQLSAQGAAVRDVEVFDPLSSKWRTGPPLLVARCAPLVVAVGGAIYAISGTVGRDASGDGALITSAERLIDGAWQMLPKVPLAPGRVLMERPTACAAVYRQKVYLIGADATGSRSSPDHGKAVLAFDPTTDEWIRQPDMVVEHSISAAVVFKGRIYAFGSMSNEAVEQPWVDSFAEGESEWREEPDFLFAVTGHCATEVDGKVWILRGCGDMTVIGTVAGERDSRITLLRDVWAIDPTLVNPYDPRVWERGPPMHCRREEASLVHIE